MSFTPTHLRTEGNLSFSLFPSNLRYLRKRKGLNQEDISALFNKKANTVGNWENGKTEPSIPELLVISGYFGVNLEDLLRSELRQQQADSERQLSFWPQGPEKPASTAASGPITGQPETNNKSILSPSARYDSSAHPAAVNQPENGTDNNERPPVPGHAAQENPLSDAPGQPHTTVSRTASSSPGEAGLAGDALWFMLRELRGLQERLDRLQSAIDHSSPRRLIDKSEH